MIEGSEKVMVILRHRLDPVLGHYVATPVNVHRSTEKARKVIGELRWETRHLTDLYEITGPHPLD